MPLPAIVISESFETGPLGEFLRPANCPGVGVVSEFGNGIFVSDAHSGAQAALLYSGLGSGFLTGTFISFAPALLLTPDDGQQVGCYFRVESSAPTTGKGFARVGRQIFSTPGPFAHVQLDASTVDSTLRVRDYYDSTPGPYDHTFALVYDQWYQVDLKATGAWKVSLPGGTVASGSIGVKPTSQYLFITTGAPDATDPTMSTGYVVDDFYYRPAPPPPPPPPEIPPGVRQYPRDDALGLGSAPRIHPPPRRSRVVGGYQ